MKHKPVDRCCPTSCFDLPGTDKVPDSTEGLQKIIAVDEDFDST